VTARLIRRPLRKYTAHAASSGGASARYRVIASTFAEVGFVALSAVLSPRDATPGSRWDVPQALYAPIRQDAVLLGPGAGNPAARAFLDFLRTPEAAAVIDRFGYGAGG